MDKAESALDGRTVLLDDFKTPAALQGAPPVALGGAAHRAFAQARAIRGVLIALPLYRHPELAEAVIGSLIACRRDIAAIGAEVVLYNDSPDDEALCAALASLLPRAQAAFRCRLEVNAENLGFVRTANRALAEAAARGLDALLLNSDTEVFPGALTEMARVARLDPMTGFVNPRSNNATLATLPFQARFRSLEPQAAHDAWKALAERLPPVSYVPTAVGFCLLIRWSVLAEFGVFDEIYGSGYNEENDLVMRAGRRGYRAVLANHAYVWHQGSVSFGQGEETDARDLANRAILQARYPEYWPLAQRYFESAEQRAELLLGALIPDAAGRLDVALDFSSFVPAHNGTFGAGAQLLAAAAEAWGARYNLFVLCAEDTYAFHGLAASGAKRREPHGPETYAAIFRVGQPYDWSALERLALKAAAFGVFMLDTISLDCSQLAEPRIRHLWAYTLEHADVVVTTSELTAAQLERRFRYGPDVLRVKSLHSLDLEDYRLPGPEPDASFVPPGSIFVVGNHYWHKETAATANALASAYPDRTILVLAARTATSASSAGPVDHGRYAPAALQDHANLRKLPAGELTDAQMGALYRDAEAIVFPSHYEGFGIPVLNALAARRPIFVRPLPVFEEMLQAIGGDPNVHVFTTTEELVAALKAPPDWASAGASPGRPRDAGRTARDVGDALAAAIESVDYSRIVRRIRTLQAAHDLCSGLAPPPQAAVPSTPTQFTARKLGEAVERGARRVLELPGVFAGLRGAVRLARIVARPARATASRA